MESSEQNKHQKVVLFDVEPVIAMFFFWLDATSSGSFATANLVDDAFMSKIFLLHIAKLNLGKVVQW